MGYPLFTNNAASGLVYPISSTDTALYLNGGSGALFPQPTGGNYFIVTLISQLTGNMEIVKCTTRSGDVLTVVRAQEGTTAQSFATGDGVQLRITSGTLNLFGSTTIQSITGTANEIAVSTTGPAVTLSLTNPINVDTTGNANTATSATNATNATKIANSGGWNVTPSGTKLYFNYNGTNVASLDSSGNLIALANVTAYGTP